MSTSPVARFAAALVLIAAAVAAQAEATQEEIARLGRDLTPLGAEQAGNADGTIPPWEGGITSPPPGYEPGMHHPDPYPDDPVLFRIDQSNVDKYLDKVSPGQLAVINTYDSFYMNVYRTRRSAAAPQRIYDATRRVAATARLEDGGNRVVGATVGVPFPIPKSGEEVMWNHIVRYRGNVVGRWIGQATPTRGGNYTLVKFYDESYFNYSQEGMSEEKLNNVMVYFIQEVLAPASLAGGILLVFETLDQVAEPRRAWNYNVGTRRVRQAPNVAYDNPGTASDGMRTNDQYDMFNGALNYYDWELVGKRELYVPYNSYKLHSDKLQYDDIVKPLHINPELPRYELHRVWVVDSKLKPDKRHIYKRRTFYVDEDSWQILVVDIYDNQDQLWRVSQGHCINYYEMPLLWSTLEVHTDLQAGRYVAIGLDNQERMYDFNLERTLADYTPQALRMRGR